MQVCSVDPSTSVPYKDIHRKLSPFFAYSVGLVPSQLKQFHKITVENKVYFAFVLLYLQIKCFFVFFFQQKLHATHLFTQNILSTWQMTSFMSGLVWHIKASDRNSNWAIPVIFAWSPALQLKHNTSMWGNTADPWTTEVNRNDALERSQLRDEWTSKFTLVKVFLSLCPVLWLGLKLSRMSWYLALDFTF